MGNEEELSLYEARRREAETEILGGKRGMITVPSGEFSDGCSFPTRHKLPFALNWR